MNELTAYLHDSYQTINDRISKIETKSESINSSLKTCESQNAEENNSVDVNAASSTNKLAHVLKTFDYQIAEMQHEYELLLEDKIIAEKLLDNQTKIFAKYKNLSNEKTLLQQYNALNQEMELLQSQLTKVSMSLNEIISEKCRQEFVFTQQQQQQQGSNKSTPQHEKASLFRASLVAVGNGSNSTDTASLTNNDTKSVSSIWKTSNSPQVPHKRNASQSNDNLINQNAVPQQNHQMYPKPQSSQQTFYQPQFMPSQLKTSIYQPCSTANSSSSNYQQFYPNNSGMWSNLNHNTHVPTIMNNNNNAGAKKLMENHLISKSIDSVYSPKMTSASNSNGAFNAVKKTNGDGNSSGGSNTPMDNTDKEIQIMFQPVNFTNSRPKQLSGMNQQPQGIPYVEQMQQQHQQYNNPNSAFTTKNPSNFKRDIIAEKKRSSIGKYPHNSGNYVTFNLLFFFSFV
jgi:hypothetical protein